MARKIPLYPRKDFAKKAAKEFLLKSKVKSLPINPYAICKQHGFVIRSVSEIEDLIDEIDPFDIRYNTDCDAKTYLTSDGRYVIVYDDSVLSQGRIIWTIAHEIAHIVLGHLEQFDQTEVNKGLTEKENQVLEKEADIFTSELLAPAEILLHCKCKTKSRIKMLCGLSDEAATYREEYVKNYKPDDKYQHLNKEIFKQFFNFINDKDFFINLHQKVCPKCKNYILSSREHFCRICGNQVTGRTLIKGFVYNDAPSTSNKKETLFCPKCLKTQEKQDGSDCKHCGISLVNKCSNSTCNKSHIESSRFCHHCGSPNSFFIDGILKEWSDTQKRYDEFRHIKRLLKNDNETGKIFDEWKYLLGFMKNEGNLLFFNRLREAVAKIDYDTLFIYSNDSNVEDWIKKDLGIVYNRSPKKQIKHSYNGSFISGS